MNPNLQVVETNNQRVLTTAQIAEQYGTDSKVPTISIEIKHGTLRESTIIA